MLAHHQFKNQEVCGMRCLTADTLGTCFINHGAAESIYDHCRLNVGAWLSNKLKIAIAVTSISPQMVLLLHIHLIVQLLFNIRIAKHWQNFSLFPMLPDGSTAKTLSHCTTKTNRQVIGWGIVRTPLSVALVPSSHPKLSKIVQKGVKSWGYLLEFSLVCR